MSDQINWSFVSDVEENGQDRHFCFPKTIKEAVIISGKMLV